MSDRLWLGPTPHDWADVNLCEQPSMADAVIAFQRLPGPHKVSGPVGEVEKVRMFWEDHFPDETVWIDPRRVDFGG